MKKQILIISLLVSGICINAQPGQGGSSRMSPEKMAQDVIASINAKNTLTTAQKDSITSAYKKFSLAVDANRKSNGGREKMMAFEQERDANIKKALADETLYAQYVKYVDEEKAKRGQHRGGQGGGPGGPPNE